MNLKIQENVLLGPFTTLGVGGPARYFTEVKNRDDLNSALEFAHANNLPIFVLSGGSNVLVSDKGFDGLVLWNKIAGFKSKVENGKATLTVGAGESWDKTVEYAVHHGFQGIECLSGIPGSAGAAPVQNIGAYGQEVSKSVKEVIAIDLKTREVVNFSKDRCGFGYRRSIFNTADAGRYVIVEVVFELQTGGRPEITYQDLKKHFEGKSEPSLKEIRKAVLEIRASKGMVIHPEYESYKSAGSFFKNSVVSKEAFDGIMRKTGLVEGGWYWPQPDGSVKISAAKLIELSGFTKGFVLGRAGISPKHALSLINLGGASATDISALAKKIIDGVREKFGVQIEPEVLMVGFNKNLF